MHPDTCVSMLLLGFPQPLAVLALQTPSDITVGAVILFQQRHGTWE